MRGIILIAISMWLIQSVDIQAQAVRKKTTAPAKTTRPAVSVKVNPNEPPNGIAVTQDYATGLVNRVKDFAEDDIKGDPRISSSSYEFVGNQLQGLCKYNFAELDTGYDREWIQKVLDFTRFFQKCKDEIDRRQPNAQDRKEFQAKFKTAYNRYCELIKKPTPANKDRIAKQRAEKRAYERKKAMQSKGNQKTLFDD